jgi:DNA-directed RNA polymerase subunit N (RpoN/RPB10)
MSTSVLDDIRKLEIEKYNIIPESLKNDISTIRYNLMKKDIEKMSQGILEMPYVRCSACGSASTSTKYERFRELTEGGLTPEKAFDKLKLKYCCRKDISNPIIIQHSLIRKDIVKGGDSLISKDLLNVGVLIMNPNTGQEKTVERKIKIANIPTLDLEIDEESNDPLSSESPRERIKKRTGILTNISPEIEYRETEEEEQEKKKMVPDWEFQDINGRNTLMENYLDLLQRKLIYAENIAIYPDWNNISEEEKVRRIEERKKINADIQNISLWDRIPNNVKRDTLIEVLISFEDKSIEEDTDIDDIDLSFLERRMDQMVNEDAGINENWRDIIFIDRRERGKDFINSYTWKPLFWHNFNSKEKNEFLTNEMERKIRENKTTLNKESSVGWGQQIVEIKRKILFEPVSKKITEELIELNDEVTKLSNSPGFLKHLRRLTLAPVTSDPSTNRRIIISEMLRLSEREFENTMQFFEESGEAARKMTKRRPDDEFIDVGAGIKVRVLKRSYMAR